MTFPRLRATALFCCLPLFLALSEVSVRSASAAETAAEESTTRLASLLRQAATFQQAGRYALAAKWYQQALTIDPQNAEAAAGEKQANGASEQAKRRSLGADFVAKKASQDKREKLFAFGPSRDSGRIGITKPAKKYRLGHRIDIAVYYDHPSWRYDPAVDRTSLQSLFSGAALPLGYPRSDRVLLTRPDGSVEEFAADTRIDILGPFEGIWDYPDGYGIGYHLKDYIRKPGVYKVQWKFGEMETPTVLLRVVRK